MNPRTVVRVTVLVCSVAACGPSAASAQTPDIRQELEQLRQDLAAIQKEYGDRISALEARLGAGTEAGAPGAGAPPQVPPTAEVPAGAAGAGGPSGTLPVYGSVSAGSKIFNPDIAVIGNFLGATGHNSVHETPALDLHEAEAAFQAVVDPYARADFFVAVGEEGAELEEGFITFPTVPGGLLVKAGKTKAAFGKVNTLHPHLLPWTDRPLVSRSLVGGDEGLADAGIAIARLISNPWFFLEATGEVYRGRSAVFAGTRRRDLTYVAHLRAYRDLGDDMNVDLGGSYAHGSNDAGAGEPAFRRDPFSTDLWGFDATVRWRPLQRAIYRSFLGRSELIWSNRGQPAGTAHSFGLYVSGEYQFARRWFAGARYDRSGRPESESLTDSGQSLTMTYWPSEFSQLRGQYRRTSYAEGSEATELLFQVLFSIGAHGAHPF
jgi:hypothetical protein